MLVRSMDVGKAAAKYEKRKNAVEAVMRGEPVSVVARVHAVPQRTIFGWLARYRAGGWLPSSSLPTTLPITPLGQSRLLPKRAREQSHWPIFRAMPRNSIQMNRSGTANPHQIIRHCAYPVATKSRGVPRSKRRTNARCRDPVAQFI